jgi:copper(I)-binding protein
MKRHFRRAVPGAGLLSLLFILVAATVHATEYRAGDLVVTNAWSRATPKGATIGVGYLELANQGKAPDRLLGASSPSAAKVEIHEMSMQGGVMRMRPLVGGLVIETVKLAPNGSHLMLIGLKSPLKKGDKVKAALNFEKAGKVEIELDVEAIGGAVPGGAMKDHRM